MRRKEKSPKGLLKKIKKGDRGLVGDLLVLSNKGLAYYLACKHGLCPKIEGGYDTTNFDKFWEEYAMAILAQHENE